MHEHRIEVQPPGRSPLSVLVDGTVEIGRDCDGVLVADARVSRRHARLSVTRTGLELVDLATTNGTYVNGERIEGAVAVGPGDRIALGDTRVVVHGTGPVRPEAADDPRGTVVSTAGGAAPRALHPERTTTLVFSDIVGSTALNEQLGDHRWMAALTEHRTVVRGLLRTHGGTEIEAQGDGFVLVFDSARRGILFGRDLQREVSALADRSADAAIRIRVGVHCGDTMAEAGDVFGQHVVVAARIGAAAERDEALVSSLAIAVAGPIDGVAYDDERHLVLKGVSEPCGVRPLRWW